MTDTSALIEGHHLVTAYPAAWCQCHHRLRWEWREQDHSAHVVAAIQAQALRDAKAWIKASSDLSTLDGDWAKAWNLSTSHALAVLDDRAARLTATTEETTT